MRPTVYIFVNGIFTDAGDFNDWNKRAVTWMQTHCPTAKAEAFLYETDAIFFRKWFQGSRVKQLIRIITEYYGVDYDIVLVGHSNGCDIICEALKVRQLGVVEVHLFSAATERDFDRNGLNAACASGNLERVHLYGSLGDRALKLAKNSNWFLGVLGVAFGWLGLEGPLNNRYPMKTFPCWRNVFDHSTWWDAVHFEESMRMIARILKATEVKLT